VGVELAEDTEDVEHPAPKPVVSDIYGVEAWEGGLVLFPPDVGIQVGEHRLDVAGAESLPAAAGTVGEGLGFWSRHAADTTHYCRSGVRQIPIDITCCVGDTPLVPLRRLAGDGELAGGVELYAKLEAL